jgi:hypothetical protein
MVAFNGVNSGVAPLNWPVLLANSPVNPLAVNGSNFIFSFISREDGAIFLGIFR